MGRPEVSFVIPSYNSKATLPLCLHAIKGQKTTVTYEVVVVDSSQDQISETLAPIFPEVKWVNLPSQTPPGVARNLGLSKANAPVTAFVDSDVVLASNWLDQALSLWGSEKPGICGAVEPYPEINPLGYCLFLIQFSKFLPVGSTRLLEIIPSYAFMVRKTEAQDAGGFPEDFPMLEDMLFSHKLSLKSGREFLFCPEMRAYHVNKRDWRMIARELRSHGMWSAKARLEADLPGGFLTRGRVMVPLLVPYRLGLILYRTLRWSTISFLWGLLLSPALILGLSVWACSFFIGSKVRRKSKMQTN